MEVRKVHENVEGISSGRTSTGTLRLTDFHLIFSAPAPQPVKPTTDSGDAFAPAPPAKRRESWITYPMISQCIFRPTPPKSRIPSSIRLRCRDFTFVMFTFPDDISAKEAFEFIRQRTCKLNSVRSLYAFHHQPLKIERGMNGWSVYDARAEFLRQGIHEKSTDKGWRLSTINKDYSFCDTYPAILAVPSSISDNTLKYAKEFRSRNRIPALTYLHPVNMCTILRSSQPRSGILRKTNIQDERLVSAAFNSNAPKNTDPEGPADAIDQSGFLEISASQVDLGQESGSSSPQQSASDDFADADRQNLYDEKTGKRLIYGAQQCNLIVDARPTLNAIMNQVQGYGSETMDNYKHTEKVFLYIGNIHVMRSSLNKVVDAIKDADMVSQPPDSAALHSSQWLKHTQAVLVGASTIARRVGIDHSHALIHCSDGWDRTSQLCALSEMMLDPYYRTIKGFMVLIEKDWLSFGHMFRLRSGHLNHESWFVIQKDALAGTTVNPGDSDNGMPDAIMNIMRRLQKGNEDMDDKQSETTSASAPAEEATDLKMVSPVFHQFLDCVYQLVRQHPNRFEFNERFLRRLLYHLYSCQYGTFLYNSEKQRADNKVAERTASVWDYFLARLPEFINPDYDPVINDREPSKERLIFPNIKAVRWWHQCFNRAYDEMNAYLDAGAAAVYDETAAVLAAVTEATASTFSGSETHSQPLDLNASISSLPPPLQQSASDPGRLQSMVTISTPPPLHVGPTMESVHTMLTPHANSDPQSTASSTAEACVNQIQEGITNINLANAVPAFLQRTTTPTAPVKPRTEQEMEEMM